MNIHIDTVTSRASRALRKAFLVGLCLLPLLALSACGKKGFPQPQDPSKNFSWKEVNATAVGNCLAFTGSFEGEYKHLDGIRLEVARLNGPEDCPGCPFVAQEVHEFSPAEAGFNPKDGTIAFSYCPRKSKAYRWKIAAMSIFNRLPHAVMVERLLVVDK